MTEKPELVEADATCPDCGCHVLVMIPAAMLFEWGTGKYRRCDMCRSQMDQEVHRLYDTRSMMDDYWQ